MKWDPVVCECNVVDYLLADKPQDRVALCTLRGDFTYHDLQVASLEFAKLLVRKGCCKGDRVVILGNNTFHWVAAYFGILRAGMVCVPLSNTVSTQELDWVIRDTEATMAFVENRCRLRYEPLLQNAGIRILHESGTQGESYFAGGSDRDAGRGGSLPNVAATDLAALMFTSGSTGTPRGVMVSHGNIVANTNSIIAAVELHETDRMMVVLPFHYCFGASLLHTYLKIGATLVLDNRFAYPDVVLQRMQETECTAFAGVPSHYQILLRNSSLATRNLPRLRSLLQAGGHLAPSFLRELQVALPGARIFVMYGQTEATARLSCLSPEMVALRPDSVGKAIPGVKLRVLKASGEEVTPGEVGEITAEGDNIAQGYWRCAAETDNSFRNGRLYTGDLATVDADGYIRIVDRVRDFLKRGGTRVSIRYIEDRILECSELLEVAIVGVPDEVLGEAIRAFVVPRSLEDVECEKLLRVFCKKELPSSLQPRDIVVVHALPKNSSGKLLREKLKNMHFGTSQE